MSAALSNKKDSRNRQRGSRKSLDFRTRAHKEHRQRPDGSEMVAFEMMPSSEADDMRREILTLYSEYRAAEPAERRQIIQRIITLIVKLDNLDLQ